MSPPSPLTDPAVQISRIRFLTEELRSQPRNGERSWLKEEDDASAVRADEPTGTYPVGRVGRATSSISSRLGGRTIAADDCCPRYRNRQSVPSSHAPSGEAARRLRYAGCACTSRSPMPAHGQTGSLPWFAELHSYLAWTYPIHE